MSEHMATCATYRGKNSKDCNCYTKSVPEQIAQSIVDDDQTTIEELRDDIVLGMHEWAAAVLKEALTYISTDDHPKIALVKSKKIDELLERERAASRGGQNGDL